MDNDDDIIFLRDGERKARTMQAKKSNKPKPIMSQIKKELTGRNTDASASFAALFKQLQELTQDKLEALHDQLLITVRSQYIEVLKSSDERLCEKFYKLEDTKAYTHTKLEHMDALQKQAQVKVKQIEMFIELLQARKVIFKDQGGGFTKCLRELMAEEGAKYLIGKIKVRQHSANSNFGIANQEDQLHNAVEIKILRKNLVANIQKFYQMLKEFKQDFSPNKPRKINYQSQNQLPMLPKQGRHAASTGPISTDEQLHYLRSKLQQGQLRVRLDAKGIRSQKQSINSRSVEDLVFGRNLNNSISLDSNESIGSYRDNFAVMTSVKDDKAQPLLRSPIKISARTLEQKHGSHYTLLSQSKSQHRKLGARQDSALLSTSLQNKKKIVQNVFSDTLSGRNETQVHLQGLAEPHATTSSRSKIDLGALVVNRAPALPLKVALNRNATEDLAQKKVRNAHMEQLIKQNLERHALYKKEQQMKLLTEKEKKQAAWQEQHSYLEEIRAYETTEAEKKRIKLMEFKLDIQTGQESRAKQAMHKEHAEAQQRVDLKRRSESCGSSISGLRKNWSKSRLTDGSMSQSQTLIQNDENIIASKLEHVENKIYKSRQHIQERMKLRSEIAFSHNIYVNTKIPIVEKQKMVKQIQVLQKQVDKKKLIGEAKQRAQEEINLRQEIAAYHNVEKDKKKFEVNDKQEAKAKAHSKIFNKREMIRMKRNESAQNLRSMSQITLREDQTVRKRIQQENYQAMLEAKREKQNAIVNKHFVIDINREFRSQQQKDVSRVKSIHQKIDNQRQVASVMKSIDSRAAKLQYAIDAKAKADKTLSVQQIAAKDKEDKRWKAEWEVDHFADLPHNKVSVPHYKVFSDVSKRMQKHIKNSPAPKVEQKRFAAYVSNNKKE